MTQIVGTYENSRDFGFVVSDNPKFSRDVFIPLQRLTVKGTSSLYIIAYICNVNTKMIDAILLCQSNCIIQILGVFSVNGDGLKMAKIQSAIPVSIQNMIWMMQLL